MQAVVMAGGKGQRLEPLTFDVPKPFLPVAGRPVVEWGILSLVRAGITDIIVTTAYKKEVLQRHLGDGRGLGATLRYSEEKPPLGTAGGVKKAEGLIEGPFVVMSGDVVMDIDIERLIDFHESRGDALATIALTQVADPTAYGIIGMDARGKIERFKEKPRREEVFSDLTNAGVFVVEREVLDRIPPETRFDWSKDVWTHMMGEALYGHIIEGYWKDVGQPEDLIEANIEQARRTGEDRFGKVEVAPDAQVVDSVLMNGTAVAAKAQITGSVLMPHVNVQAEAQVESSVLGEGVRVGRGAQVVGCVLGRDVAVPAGEQWVDRREPEPSREALERVQSGRA